MDPEASSTENLPLALLAKITNYFSDDLRIGHGGFAVVYKGRLGRGKMVAVKKLSEKIDMDETKSEYQGKFVMADVRHRLLCFEYLSKGSLRNYISDASCGLDWAKRYEIIKGICEGLSYLHEKRIVHLDLKPENILLNDDMVPKISDFGLSRCFDEDQTRAMASKLLGTTGYMAPEFYDKVITAKSDIYSLGVIFTEILTGQKGYSTQNNVVECWRNRSEGSLSETLLEQVRVCAKISIDCMNFDPTKRPDARSIIHKLAGTERTNDDFNKFGMTHSLMVQPSRINLHLPREKLPVASLNADAILEDKSSTRRFAMISSARANCTRAVSAVIVKIDAVLADEAAKAVVEKHHGEAVELQNKIRNIRERLTFMAKMSKVCMNSDAWCEEVRNLAYRVEDMIDKYFYYSFKMKDESFLKTIITESHNAHVFSEIADELVKVDMEIENIKQINDMKSPSSLDVLDDIIEKERQRSQVSFQEFLKHEDLVGIEDNRRMLTEWLYFDELSTVITVLEILDVTKGSFPELKTLVLEYMDDVDNLVLRYGALPMIEALYIMSLTKLDKVPHGLESLAHLKKLWLLNLHTNFSAQWHKNGMHNKMQHVTEIRI
ncbi:hypothetical protein QOZ80_5BG0431370 [Eleusine coracana subsp. coracana]|nr:hypothetical protein QOZ80_5BG0431370 [Eleusine coracana subsp. coracana]